MKSNLPDQLRPFSQPSLLAAFARRAVDLTLVLITAPIWVTLCWLIAGLIWVEDWHHPLFRQVRVGQDGRLFEAYRFRTMATEAESVFDLQQDPRLTRMGRFLRRTSLDGLPQLLNVLAGELALWQVLAARTSRS